MESVSLIDAVYSARLTVAGLPALANVQTEQTGVAPSTDPYAAPSSSLTQLSGYGQLLSAADRASNGFSSLLSSNSNFASSSSTSVATATATSSATAASYALNVTQKAVGQTLESGYFADPAEQLFSAGSFSITVGSATPVTVTLQEGTGLIEGVNYPWGSLTGLASAINSASAGVTASVESSSFGYKLKLESNTTGADNAISLTAPTNDPFNTFVNNLTQLGFTQTQAASDATFTIDGVAGTSASNTGIALADGASFSIAGTGATTITISSTSFVAADLSSVTTAANKLVQDYNSLQGTATQLIASGGSLNGDTTTATPLSSAIYLATKDTYVNGASTLTTLAQLGITDTAQTNPLSLNTATLTAAFTSDAAGTASLLTSVANTLHSLIAGYLGNSGTILTQAKSVEQNMSFINGQPASSYSNLSNDIKQYLLQKSLASASVPPGLPDISVFA